VNDYYLGTPKAIPRVARLVAWVLAIANLIVMMKVDLGRVPHVLGTNFLELLLIHRPEMFEDTEWYDRGQQRWQRAITSESTVWYIGWLALLLPGVLLISFAIGRAI